MLPLLGTGCDGPLSSLDPASPQASAVADLWWIMLVGSGLVFLLVMTLLTLAFTSARRYLRRPHAIYILGGGLVFPATVLSVLLAYALFTGERLLADPARPAALRVQAMAAQWQWTFRYASGIEMSDRLVLPAGQPVDIAISSQDVIHSFWIPRLGGKIDALPGRIHVMRIISEQVGTYAGACAEFCGLNHAGMYFTVEVVPLAEFETVLRQAMDETRSN
jgi:cytochrome c oxidase, subunit II